MGIIKRQTIQSSIYAYAGVGVGFLTQGIFFPHLFSKEQVGLLSLLISVSQVLAQASNLGLNSAGGRYFPYFRSVERQHNGYLLIANLTTFVGCGLCALVLWLARPWVIEQYQAQSALFVDYYYLLIPLMVFTVFFCRLRHLFPTAVRSRYWNATATVSTADSDIVSGRSLLARLGHVFSVYRLLAAGLPAPVGPDGLQRSAG